ncbi:hypothetical protein KEM52_000288 [Ascosphaera acerosa]|nr:hypothetical protein KEM52_000288 [Ascosphaera acerosa]
MRYDLLPTLRRIPWTREADRPEQQAKEAALRYELRMKPFSPITIPEVMPFDIFRAAAEMESDSDQEVMERASRAIAETKRGLEHYISLVTNMQSQSGSPSAPAAARGPTPTVFRDWLADAKDCMRACIGASLAISMVGKAMKEAAPTADGRPPLPLHVDIPSDDDKMRYHPWWAVPRITPAPLGS